MPIYEYKCAECGNHVERMQKISDAPLTVCEVCGGKLEKQWSLSGIQFKGAGWYVTDYSNKLKDTSAAAKSDKKAEKTETADKSDNSENKSAVESTTKTESASNTASETAATAKKETTAKKD